MIILKAILLMLRDFISYLFWIAVFIFGGIWLFTGFGIVMIVLLLSDGHWLMALPIILIDVILLCRIICCYMEDIKNKS